MDSRGIFGEVVSHPARSGLFERVNDMHEPKSAPSARGLTCAVWVDDLLPARSSSLAATTALLVCMVRVYSSMIQEPMDAIDPRVFSAMDDLWGRYIGDLTLGGKVRTIDVRGMAGVAMRARAGYIEQDRKVYRCMTLTLPMLVNDAWPEIP